MTTNDVTSFEKTPALPTSSPPGVRYDENYGYLSNAVYRSDLFDPIKYIPLPVNDPSWYLTLGGEVRERFEGYYNPNFGIGGVGPDSHLLQRLVLLADLHLGERVRVFASGISGLQFGGIRPPLPVQQDPVALQYAFLEYDPYLTADERLALRAGRFTLGFGSGRLVDPRGGPDAPNIPFAFNGLEMVYTRPLWEVTAFGTQQGHGSFGIIDAEDNLTAFWGLYVTHWFDAPHTLGLDL